MWIAKITYTSKAFPNESFDDYYGPFNFEGDIWIWAARNDTPKGSITPIYVLQIEK